MDLPLSPAIAEDDLIPISALQHYLFCRRQFALIHIERLWADNVFTAEGNLLHQKVDTLGIETRKGISTVRAMPLRSLELGVAGVADVVELHRHTQGVKPYPVEYKRGRPHAHRADEVQLCAQGIALEEMFGVTIDEGALFYGKTRRRTIIPLDDDLRALTYRIAREARALLSAGQTPAPIYIPRNCRSCSLLEHCRPERFSRRTDVFKWLSQCIDG